MMIRGRPGPKLEKVKGRVAFDLWDDQTILGRRPHRDWYEKSEGDVGSH